jgi:hypothetical protein
MENKISLSFDNNLGKNLRRQYRTSYFINEQLEQYNEYVYNGNFSITRFFFGGILNLIKDCFRWDS